MPALFHDSRRRRIGLIGGSFNPAHDGHLHMALTAHKTLQLDEIWMLVSPQNPLKSANAMQPLAARIDHARQITAPYPFIKVISPEVGFRSSYTYKTLNSLQVMAPKMAFTWIMGADNLVQFFAWREWRRIKNTMPIAVIDRPSYSYQAICAGRKLKSARLSSRQLAKHLTSQLTKDGVCQTRKAPFWCFIAGRRHHASATALRALQGK